MGSAFIDILFRNIAPDAVSFIFEPPWSSYFRFVSASSSYRGKGGITSCGKFPESVDGQVDYVSSQYPYDRALMPAEQLVTDRATILDWTGDKIEELTRSMRRWLLEQVHWRTSGQEPLQNHVRRVVLRGPVSVCLTRDNPMWISRERFDTSWFPIVSSAIEIRHNVADPPEVALMLTIYGTMFQDGVGDVEVTQFNCRSLASAVDAVVHRFGAQVEVDVEHPPIGRRSHPASGQ